MNFLEIPYPVYQPQSSDTPFLIQASQQALTFLENCRFLKLQEFVLSLNYEIPDYQKKKQLAYLNIEESLVILSRLVTYYKPEFESHVLNTSTSLLIQVLDSLPQEVNTTDPFVEETHIKSKVSSLMTEYKRLVKEKKRLSRKKK